MSGHEAHEHAHDGHENDSHGQGHEGGCLKILAKIGLAGVILYLLWAASKLLE